MQTGQVRSVGRSAKVPGSGDGSETEEGLKGHGGVANTEGEDGESGSTEAEADKKPEDPEDMTLGEWLVWSR